MDSIFGTQILILGTISLLAHQVYFSNKISVCQIHPNEVKLALCQIHLRSEFGTRTFCMVCQITPRQQKNKYMKLVALLGRLCHNTKLLID